MNYKFYSLVDITETNARREDDSKLYRQHQNYMSFLQTLSLRYNPIIRKAPKKESIHIDNLGFGSSFTGKQNVWIVDFEIEREIAEPLETIEKDFDFVPIIVGLEETATFKNNTFLSTNSKHKNIILKEIE